MSEARPRLDYAQLLPKFSDYRVNCLHALLPLAVQIRNLLDKIRELLVEISDPGQAVKDFAIDLFYLAGGTALTGREVALVKVAVVVTVGVMTLIRRESKSALELMAA